MAESLGKRGEPRQMGEASEVGQRVVPRGWCCKRRVRGSHFDGLGGNGRLRGAGADRVGRDEDALRVGDRVARIG